MRATRPSARSVLAAIVVAILAAACTTPGVSPRASGTASLSPSTPAEIASPSPPPVASVPSPATPAPSTVVDRPPDANLWAEGGDPVTGQLGSYTWAGGGSDSSWLPGSPIAVGAGEPLTVRLARPAVVADWSATRVTAGTTDGTGAVALASAEAEPIRFVAPPPGRWSIQVQVRFDGGSDSATYYWLVDVR